MRVLMAAVCVSVALGAAACEKKQDSTPGAGNGSVNTGTDATTPKPEQATGALAAMNSFIEAMGEGRFADALAFVEPESDLHVKMSATVANLETLRNSGSPNSAEALKVIEVGFAAPYKRAQASVVTEEAERAMLELRRVGDVPMQVAMVKGQDGNWRIDSDDRLFSPVTRGGGGPTNPPTPTPETGGGDDENGEG